MWQGLKVKWDSDLIANQETLVNSFTYSLYVTQNSNLAFSCPYQNERMEKEERWWVGQGPSQMNCVIDNWLHECRLWLADNELVLCWTEKVRWKSLGGKETKMDGRGSKCSMHMYSTLHLVKNASEHTTTNTNKHTHNTVHCAHSPPPVKDKLLKPKRRRVNEQGPPAWCFLFKDKQIFHCSLSVYVL